MKKLVPTLLLLSAMLLRTGSDVVCAQTPTGHADQPFKVFVAHDDSQRVAALYLGLGLSRLAMGRQYAFQTPVLCPVHGADDPSLATMMRILGAAPEAPHVMVVGYGLEMSTHQLAALACNDLHSRSLWVITDGELPFVEVMPLEPSLELVHDSVCVCLTVANPRQAEAPLMEFFARAKRTDEPIDLVLELESLRASIDGFDFAIVPLARFSQVAA